MAGDAEGEVMTDPYSAHLGSSAGYLIAALCLVITISVSLSPWFCVSMLVFAAVVEFAWAMKGKATQ